MKIVLLSGWFGPFGLKRFQVELIKLSPQPKVAIIHNALRYRWFRSLNDWVINYRLKALGCQSVTVDLQKPGWPGKIAACNAVYIGGGDTRRLLNTLRTGRCGEQIFAHLTKCGGIYVGVSAGAIVCGSSIEPGDWLGDSQKVTVASMFGYGLLSDNSVVFPHYKNSKHSQIITRQKASGFTPSVWKLRDGESIFLSGNEPYRYD